MPKNFFLILSFLFPNLLFAQLPLEGMIQDTNHTNLAKVQIYHEYVEVYSLDDKFLARVGILSDTGFINIFITKNKDTDQEEINNSDAEGEKSKQELIAYARMGIIYDLDDKWLGSYSVTPTYTYIFDNLGNRLGRVKCLAWQRICGLGAASFLLKQLEPTTE